MIRLSKKVEYALMALKHFAVSNGNVITAKEISDKHKIPYELLAKILQRLKRENVLTSIQGTKGGYQLNRKPDQINLHFLMNTIDGNLALTECQCAHNKGGVCVMNDTCNIKQPISVMQREIEEVFKRKTISDFV